MTGAAFQNRINRIGLAAGYILFIAIPSLANNPHITNYGISFVSEEGYAMIRLGLSWENSWRDAENHDALWLFVKYFESDAWQHATLNYVDGTASGDGHVVPPEAALSTTPDGMGAFIYRSEPGAGNFAVSDVLLRWNYQADGLANPLAAGIVVQAIEMVYVPEGSFYAGDGAASGIRGNFESGTTGAPFLVDSEGEIILGGGSAGSLGNNNREGMANSAAGAPYYIPAGYLAQSQDDFDDATERVLPAAFPKGYRAFYCMKYEMTQGQYVVFLNMLSEVQANNRHSLDPHADDEASFRYNLSGVHPNIFTTTPHLPMNFIEYQDGAAYADWAGLRPMTELEFEKACRGPAVPQAGEYAWGTTTISTNYYPLTNIAEPNEGVAQNFSLAAGNAWYNETMSIPNAMVRVGVFAANGTNTGRISSGASYWGIFELSGNCSERAVTVGRPEGRGFQGTHGDGILSPAGDATNPDWPGYAADAVSEPVGCGYRGGDFSFPVPVLENLAVSSRRMATAFYNIRYFSAGMRLVRTAP